MIFNATRKFRRILAAGFLGIFLLLSLQSGASAVITFGETAPAFRAKDLRGEWHSAEKYRGKVWVIYFWAVWCPACRREVPGMIRAYERFRARGVEFLAVSLDKNLSSLQNYVDQNKVPYPVVFSGRAWDNSLAELYKIRSTPSFYVVGKDGKFLAAGNWSSELLEVLGKVTG